MKIHDRNARFADEDKAIQAKLERMGSRAPEPVPPNPWKWRAVLVGEGGDLVLKHGDVVEIKHTIAQMLLQYEVRPGVWATMDEEGEWSN